MKTWTLRISLALLGLLAIVGIIFSFGAVQELTFLKEGSVNGFKIDDSYSDHKSGLGDPSFHTEDTSSRWQLVDTKQNITNGTFEATEDPNIFLLKDTEGNEYGVAHLAYASGKGDQGCLYLKNKSGTALFDKVSKHSKCYEIRGKDVVTVYS